jgi:protein-S-isoprenylcysteine O-methyltransferase
MFEKLKSTISFCFIFFVMPLIGQPSLIFHWQVLVLFLVWSILIWTEPKSTDNVVKDRRTIIITVLLALCIPLCEWAYFRVLPVSQYSIKTGLVLIFIGMFVRLWAVYVLGRFFSRDLVIQPNHQLISVGPYRIVRHPAYLGSLMVIVGQAVFLGNWMLSLSCGFMVLFAYLERIIVEEKVLHQHFTQQFTNYSRRTWKIIPFIY